MNNLPDIPNKLYFTISEAAKLCEIKAHVLRYWEQEFSCLKPLKRRGNRRYYQHKDIVLVRYIKHLLHEEGFTIEGAKAKLARTSGQSDETGFKTKMFLNNLLSNLQQIISEMDEDVASGGA
jgi:DNA-binding transcriptional MerR regulator